MRLLIAWLAITSSIAFAQTTSSNLVPSPGATVSNGYSLAQSYAINQALASVGAGVQIHGFDYGFRYNIGADVLSSTTSGQGQCPTCQQPTIVATPSSVSAVIEITDSNNTALYNNNYYFSGNSAGVQSADYTFRFNNAIGIANLGHFNYTVNTFGSATVSDMYSQAVYSIDQCVVNPQSSPTCPGYQAPVVLPTTPSLPKAMTTTEPVVINLAVDSVTDVTSPTSPISVLPQPPSLSTLIAPAPPAKSTSAESAEDAKKTASAVAKAAAQGATAAAAKKALAAAAKAKTMEDQAAGQGLVVGLMGYVPGFNSYQNVLVPDTMGAEVARKYTKPNVDNRNAQRRLSGANELRWQEMVDSQYK